MKTIDPRTEVTGVVLAGGQGRRMGGTDKGLLELAGKPMVQHVLERLRPQVKTVLINANRNTERYAKFGCQVVADRVGDFFGPLAGMASGMRAARTEFVLTVPCDSPLVAADLAERLASALNEHGADIAVASDGERLHPVFALLACRLYDSVVKFLEHGERKIDRWFEGQRTVVVDFSDRRRSFLNVNHPEDRDVLEQELATGDG